MLQELSRSLRGPNPQFFVPRGIRSSGFSLPGSLLGLCNRSRRHLAHYAPKGVRVLAGAVLARRINELLALASGVFFDRSLALCHGASRWLPIVDDLRLHREVLAGNLLSGGRC